MSQATHWDSVTIFWLSVLGTFTFFILFESHSCETGAITMPQTTKLRSQGIHYITQESQEVPSINWSLILLSQLLLYFHSALFPKIFSIDTIHNFNHSIVTSIFCFQCSEVPSICGNMFISNYILTNWYSTNIYKLGKVLVSNGQIHQSYFFFCLLIWKCP